MSLERQAEAAELAEHGDAIRHHGKHPRSGILMQVLHVPDAAIGPAARAIDQSRRIVLHRPLQNVVGVVLSPAFVERHPADDAREERQVIDHRLEFLAIDRLLVFGEDRIVLGVRRDEVLLPVRLMQLGMSCQTSRPSLSQW